MIRYIITLSLFLVISGCHIVEGFFFAKAINSETNNKTKEEPDEDEEEHDCACKRKEKETAYNMCICQYNGVCSSNGDHYCCTHKTHREITNKVCGKIEKPAIETNPPMPSPNPTPSPIPVPICPDRDEHCKEKEDCAINDSMKCCKTCHNHCL